MTEEQAFALADPNGPLYAPGAFLLALGALRAEPRITEAFRTGEGVGWHEHDDGRVHRLRAVLPAPATWRTWPRAGSPRSTASRPSWPPARRVADVGCGLGASSRAARRRPTRSARIAGSDYHDRSIELARKRAADAGVADRVSFEVASAQTFAGRGYDLVTTFDCLHDMGDPLGAARHVREALAPDGTWMIVEPARGRPGRGQPQPRRPGVLLASRRSSACRTGSPSPAATRSGAQAGEAAIRQVATDAGFTRFRRAAETPFNLVYEVRP